MFVIVTADIHSHSGYSGGVGKIDFFRLTKNLTKKGINIFSSGDILHKKWRETLRDSLQELEAGLFVFKDSEENSGQGNSAGFIDKFQDKILFDSESKLSGSETVRQKLDLFEQSSLNRPRIILQTEIVASVPYIFDAKKRKSAHLILLFPDFEIVEKVYKIFENKGVKLNIGRPFIRFSSISECENFFGNLCLQFGDLEVIPAHIFTPDGIFGGENPIDRFEDFFGDFKDKIRCIESGLSADPLMIAKVPFLRNLTVISNSDAHSEGLNRVGREFFALNLDYLDYHNFINAIRTRKVAFSVEFRPEHGRYFHTGHSEKRHNNGENIHFIAEDVPEDLICPICGKKMTAGVEYRVFQLSGKNKKNEIEKMDNPQKFFYSIPLADIIAASLKIKSDSKKVLNYYEKIINKIGFESSIFLKSDEQIKALITDIDIPDRLKDDILRVKNGKFCFDPQGFDGEYGRLKMI